jgi:hypothetical protein
MNVIATAKAFNQRAARQKWHQAVDPTLAFSNSYYDPLLAVWRAKAGDRKMPARSQMTPRDLKDYLRHIILIQREQEDPPRYRWRVIGTSVTDIVGHNTGKFFDDCVPTQHLQRWYESLELILSSGQPWRFLGRVQLGGREYLKAENLYMPLADDEGMPSFVMGLCRYSQRQHDNDELSEDEALSVPGCLL